MAKKKRGKPEKSGGLVFFISLACLCGLAILNTFLLLGLWEQAVNSRLLNFAIGLGVGVWFASFFIRGKTSVLIHEYKHAIFSGFVGNKAKNIKVEGGGGHFEYEYTKDTKEYNGFIALAPYWLPMFSLPAICLLLLFRPGNPIATLVILGMAYGCDLTLNLRDLSPRQSDLYLIRGGAIVGLAYAVAINTVVASYLAAWVFADMLGLKFLFFGLFQFVIHLVSHYIKFL